MKSIEEIRKATNLIILDESDEGGAGRIIRGKLDASVIFSWGAGWDHVSISPYKRHYIPTWDDMCWLKKTFFYPYETVIEYHPAESEYVNMMQNCLHLWRPQNCDLPVPPKILTGINNRISRGEYEKQLKEAYANPYALTDKIVEGLRHSEDES